MLDTMTNLEGHWAHSDVGDQEQEVREAETDQQFVKHGKHHLGKHLCFKRILKTQHFFGINNKTLFSS